MGFAFTENAGSSARAVVEVAQALNVFRLSCRES